MKHIYNINTYVYIHISFLYSMSAPLNTIVLILFSHYDTLCLLGTILQNIKSNTRKKTSAAVPLFIHQIYRMFIYYRKDVTTHPCPLYRFI